MESSLTKGITLASTIDISNKDANARFFSTEYIKANHHSLVGIFKVGNQQEYEVTLHSIEKIGEVAR